METPTAGNTGPWKFFNYHLFKESCSSFLDHIEIAVSMETGIKTASRRGHQIWLFPTVVFGSGWAGRPRAVRGTQPPLLELRGPPADWEDVTSIILGGRGPRSKPAPPVC